MLRVRMYTMKTQCFILSILLAAIGRLQRVDGTVQKLLDDAYERTAERLLVKRIQRHDWIDYDYFNGVYAGFVEKKRQSLLKDINGINSRFMECLRERQEAGIPNEGMPAETQMELAVLNTYYAYLADDDMCQQKAFTLFLEKKMEELAGSWADCSEIEGYLENKYRDDHVHAECIAYISMPVNVHLPGLWAEFFRSGAGYGNVIPEERPDVAYFSSDTGIPRFIFQKPYAPGYSGQEFHDRFVREWDITHYNPYDDGCNDPAYYAEYDDGLHNSIQNAYCRYLFAANRFKKIKQRLKPDAGMGSVL